MRTTDNPEELDTTEVEAEPAANNPELELTPNSEDPLVASELSPGDRSMLVVSELKERRTDPARGTPHFDRWVRAHRFGLERFAQTVVRDPTAAEDAVSTALLRVLERIDQVREPRAFGAWVRQIVYNEARLELRRDRTGAAYVERLKQGDFFNENPDPENVPSPEQRYFHAQVMARLDAAAENVAPKMRAGYANFINEVSYKEGARSGGVSVSALKSQIHRGVRSVAKEAGFKIVGHLY
ncbi:hypothetical protein CO046_01715 [Candidatus Peregrinibacteria bacterium CG_4_9_14_0_2_um_filter_53_11]|nr:MAG: hypothetical protein CO046_01715 [Candidatus Peregrinibacteria bacterium CG_4_9_14_0_2_um_filter_53_11]